MLRALIALVAAAGVVVACTAHEPSGPPIIRNATPDSTPAHDSTPQSAGGHGTIAGGVISQDSNGFVSIDDATVWVYAGDPANPATWSLKATARTTATLGFRIDSMPVGTYFLRADKSDDPFHAPGLSHRFQVSAEWVLGQGVFLTDVGKRGMPYVRLWPRRIDPIAVCGDVYLRVSVGDERGEPIADPVVTWVSSNHAVAAIGDTVTPDWTTARIIHAVGAGDAIITVTRSGLRDSVPMHVVPNGMTCPWKWGPSVATVDVSPASATIAVGDTVGVTASPRDSAGNLILDRPVSWWSSSDSTFVDIVGAGAHIIVHGRKAGTTILRASVDGKSSQATITVH
jgi:hypothetical protein